MRIALLVFILAIATWCHGQSLEFAGFSIGSQAGGTDGGLITSSQLRTLGSGLVAPHINNLSAKSIQNYRFHGGLNLNSYWNPRNKKGILKPQLRIGLHFGSYTLGNLGAYFQTNTYRVDTFISTRTGEMYFVDSIHKEFTSLDANAKMLGVNFDYIYRLRSDKKLSLYFGVGGSINTSLSNILRASFNEYNTSGSNQGNHYYKNDYFVSRVVDSKKLRNLSTFSLYVPIGVNYRLSNKSALLKHVNVFGEIQPGLEFSSMSGISSNLGFRMVAASGLRISLGKN